jgi:multiple sugar transport system ATP-binding protein
MVVLDFGKEQQYAPPQDMYNQPENLFVAKFLGNPPINSFKGEIKNKKLIINNKPFMDVNISDGVYDIGMRPENFRAVKQGFEVDIKDIFHVGRDTMIHFQFNEVNIRALVDSDSITNLKDKVHLSIKPERVYIFEENTGKVINHG